MSDGEESCEFWKGSGLFVGNGSPARAEEHSRDAGRPTCASGEMLAERLLIPSLSRELARVNGESDLALCSRDRS